MSHHTDNMISRKRQTVIVLSITTLVVVAIMCIILPPILDSLSQVGEAMSST